MKRKISAEEFSNVYAFCSFFSLPQMIWFGFRIIANENTRTITKSPLNENNAIERERKMMAFFYTLHFLFQPFEYN